MAERLLLDCKGLKCPMPLIRLNKLIKTLSSGAEVEVHATDLAFAPDIQAWAETTGHMLLEQQQEGDVLKAVIRKS